MTCKKEQTKNLDEVTRKNLSECVEISKRMHPIKIYLDESSIENNKESIEESIAKEGITSIIVQHQSSSPNNNVVISDNLISVYQTIGRVPTLQKLKISFCKNGGCIQYGILAAVLKCACKLTHLELICSNLTESSFTRNSSDKANDFENFINMLKSHKSLEDFKLSLTHHHYDAASRSENSSFSSSCKVSALNDIVMALTNVDTLETIRIHARPPPYRKPYPSGLSSQAVKLLCSGTDMPKLKVLKLGGLKLELDKHVRTIALAMAQSTCQLRELSLFHCGIDSEGSIELANMIRSNRSLKKLDLSWNSIGDIGCIAFAKALSKTTNNWHNATTTNTTLEALYLHRDNEGITKKSFGDIERMLQSNYGIQDLWITPLDEDFQSKIRFHLKLNRSGKRSMLRNNECTIQDWIEALASQTSTKSDQEYDENYTISSLFYYLSNVMPVYNPC